MTIAKANIVRLASDCSELGEGPHYDRARDTAYWFDITGCRLHEHRFASGETVSHVLPRMAQMLRFDVDRAELILVQIAFGADGRNFQLVVMQRVDLQ